MQVTLVILIVLWVVLVILSLIMDYRKDMLFLDIMENYDNLIDTQLKLEQIALDAELYHEANYITLAKINKVLFPDWNQGK